MQISDALKHKTDMRHRAQLYCQQPIDPDLAAMRLKPLSANTYAASNGQLAAHYALPKAQLQTLDAGNHTPDYATWGVFAFPFV